jgi:hypothetical protein
MPGAVRGNSRDDLNRFNRPVRTRMPGGVGGVRPETAGPYPVRSKSARPIATLAPIVERELFARATFE